MTQSFHHEARELIAIGDAATPERQAWLRSHLGECEACRAYAQEVRRAVEALRSVPLSADSRLVRATQMRVRFHASRLRETRERMWLVATACLGVGLSAAFTLPLLWRLFAWIGGQAGVSAMVWQGAFVAFFVTPTLAVGLLLLARGTHLASHEERSRQW